MPGHTSLYRPMINDSCNIGNMVGDAFLSAMVVTREFGLIEELSHMVFQSAIS